MMDSMKLIVHIHAYNVPADRTLQAVLGQTYPIEAVVVIDNDAPISILQAPVPSCVQVLRNARNCGPGGAVVTGLTYALHHHYDWIWILDGDSLPRKDALARLVALYSSFEPDMQASLGILSSAQILVPSPKLFLGRCLTPRGPRPPKIEKDLVYCECDSILWSGSLINLDAVRTIGLPRYGARGPWHDLSFDYGDMAFAYRLRTAGYRILVHRSSIIDHPVGHAKLLTILNRPLLSTNHAAHRRYLFFRNLVYFWMYLYNKQEWVGLSLWFSYRLMVTICGILLLEQDRMRKIEACLVGALDGLRENLEEPYRACSRWPGIVGSASEEQKEKQTGDFQEGLER